MQKSKFDPSGPNRKESCKWKKVCKARARTLRGTEFRSIRHALYSAYCVYSLKNTDKSQLKPGRRSEFQAHTTTHFPTCSQHPQAGGGFLTIRGKFWKMFWPTFRWRDAQVTCFGVVRFSLYYTGSSVVLGASITLIVRSFADAQTELKEKCIIS